MHGTPTAGNATTSRGSGFCGDGRHEQTRGARRDEGQTRSNLDRESVERVDRGVGTRGQPFGEPGFRIGTEAENRGLITGKIGKATATTPSEHRGAHGREDRSTGAPFRGPKSEKHSASPVMRRRDRDGNFGGSARESRATGNL